MATDTAVSAGQAELLRKVLEEGVLAVLGGDAALRARAHEAGVEAPPAVASATATPIYVAVSREPSNIQRLREVLEVPDIEVLDNWLEKPPEQELGVVTAYVSEGERGKTGIVFVLQSHSGGFPYDTAVKGFAAIDVGHGLTFPTASVETMATGVLGSRQEGTAALELLRTIKNKQGAERDDSPPAAGPSPGSDAPRTAGYTGPAGAPPNSGKKRGLRP